MLPDKNALLQEIRRTIEQELALVTQAAKAAHEAATHEESKAEDAHDTRAIESSYLAGAQAQRAAELQQALVFYKHLELRKFGAQDPIAPGALVELDSGGKKTLCFLAQHGGGMRVSLGSKTIQLVTPHSTLGEELLGRRVGDGFEIEAPGGTPREYEIMGVA